MRLLASLADFLADIGAPIGGGFGLGAVFGWLIGLIVKALLDTETFRVRVGAWGALGGGIGSVVGLVAALYDG